MYTVVEHTQKELEEMGYAKKADDKKEDGPKEKTETKLKAPKENK